MIRAEMGGILHQTAHRAVKRRLKRPKGLTDHNVKGRCNMLDKLYLEACANRHTVRDGATWYSRARRECARIAEANGLRTRTVVGIVAALSPRIAWDLNLRAAANVAAGRPAGAGLGRNVQKAVAIRNGLDPESILSGPKVHAFYQAILGDEYAIVIDVWILRALGHKGKNCTPKQYKKYAEIVRNSAVRCGCRAAEFQAIVWVHVRQQGVK